MQSKWDFIIDSGTIPPPGSKPIHEPWGEVMPPICSRESRVPSEPLMEEGLEAHPGEVGALKACTFSGFLPQDSFSGHSEKHLIHNCLETWAIFFFPDSHFTSSEEVTFPYPANQMSGEGRDLRTKQMAEKAGGWCEPRAAGRLRIYGSFYLLYKWILQEKTKLSFFFSFFFIFIF